MAGKWKEVARLCFKGDRFRDHALDLSALTELRQFHKMVAATAKALWHAAHPDRANPPAHFDERTRLCLRRIEEGSAVVPLEVFTEPPSQAELWDAEPESVHQAIELAYEVFDSLGHDRPLPERFAKHLVGEYAEWGATLRADESIELQTATARNGPARIDAGIRERLRAFVETHHASTLEIVGEVLEADVRARQFQVYTDPKTAVKVTFDASQEATVTEALRDHRVVRIRVRGRADSSPQGKPIRFTEVSSLVLVRDGELHFDANAPSIEDEIAEIAATVSDEAWDRVPKDFTDQLDHYLYGTPKR